MPFEPIENYGVIGNMQSIGLVGMNGSIDFLCYPNFDSATIFAALLDDQNGGRFEIRPQLSRTRVRQMYLPETNILITRFLAEEGVSELTDYMPIDNDGVEPNELVRKVAVIRGDVNFQVCCKPRFSYATCGHQLELSELCATFRPLSSDCPPMSLQSSVRLGRRDDDVTADFRLKAGQTATFLFGSVRGSVPDGGLQASSVQDGGTQPELDLLDQRFRNTVQFWKAWISKSRYKGRWREMVLRSALVLKLLISRKYGSLIAAPTFSLPETIGGVRNWDRSESVV